MRAALFSTVVAGICLPFARAAVPAHMNGLFTVDNSCNGIDLDQVLTDTVALLNAGVTAVNTLLNNPNFDDATTRLYMKNMKNAFGTSYFRARVSSSYTGYDTTILQQVQITLNNVQRYLGMNRAPRITPQTHFLACGSTSYQQTTNAQDIDPSVPDGTTTEALDGSEFVYYIPGHKDANGVETVVIRPDEMADGDPSTLCEVDGGTLYAFTVLSFPPTLNQIVLCPRALDTSKSLRSIAGITSSSSPGNNGKSTSNIGNYESTPGTFLHEIIHLLGSRFNEQSYAWNLRPGTDLQCYGPTLTYLLANLMGMFKALDGMPLKGTTQAPDPYMYFCMSSLWTFQKWRFLF